MLVVYDISNYVALRANEKCPCVRVHSIYPTMINEWPLWSSLKGARYYQYTYNSHDWYEELIHAF